jgi:hypothetical protein
MSNNLRWTKEARDEWVVKITESFQKLGISTKDANENLKDWYALMQELSDKWNELKCCATCEYWLEKYRKCEHPEQIQIEADDYTVLPEKYCELWESNSK